MRSPGVWNSSKNAGDFKTPFLKEGSPMLVLTRKPSERIIIGDTIEVKVLEIRGGKVKLGFQCPPEISIRREEVECLPRTAHARAEERELVLAMM
jgi:carbon storage regulator